MQPSTPVTVPSVYPQNLSPQAPQKDQPAPQGVNVRRSVAPNTDFSKMTASQKMEELCNACRRGSPEIEKFRTSLLTEPYYTDLEKESLVDALVGGKKEKEECLQIMLKNWGRNFKRSLSYKMLYEGANIKLTAEQRTKEIVEQYDSKKYFGIDRDLFHRTVLEHLDTAHKEWKTLGFLDQLTDVRSNDQSTNPNTSLQTGIPINTDEQLQDDLEIDSKYTSVSTNSRMDKPFQTNSKKNTNEEERIGEEEGFTEEQELMRNQHFLMEQSKDEVEDQDQTKILLETIENDGSIDLPPEYLIEYQEGMHD